MDLQLLQETIHRVQFFKAHVTILRNDPAITPARAQQLMVLWNVLHAIHQQLLLIKNSKIFT